MKKKKRGFVYLLYDQWEERIYKIGVTTGSIEKRIKKLQTGNSGEITMSRYYETDYPFFIERALHLKYESKKVLNEWFSLTDEDAKNFIPDCKKIEERIRIMENNPFFPKNVR